MGRNMGAVLFAEHVRKFPPAGIAVQSRHAQCLTCAAARSALASVRCLAPALYHTSSTFPITLAFASTPSLGLTYTFSN